jgi:hypothetical protein
MLIHELTKKSNKNVDFMIKNYPLLLQYSFSDTYFMKLIYTLLCKAQDTQTKTILKHVSGEYLKTESGRFFPDEIKIHIDSTKYELYTIKIFMKKTQFEILLYTKEPTDIQRFVYFIRLVLVFCSKDSDLKDSYKMTFILTPFEKECGERIDCLDTIHVNSGYNYDEVICIFRKEELLKVFIHECFHMFCLDFKNVSVDFKAMLTPLFHVESDYLLFESLCEFWARTLNSAIFAFFISKNISYEEFERYFNMNLNLEMAYSIVQMKHFLSKFDMTYKDVIEGTITPYKEKTNGICYYVITAILLFNYQQTINWFIDHNETLLQFTKTQKQVYLFYHYIKSVYKSDKLLNSLDYIKKYDLNHLSMSVFDIDLFKHSSRNVPKETSED